MHSNKQDTSYEDKNWEAQKAKNLLFKSQFTDIFCEIDWLTIKLKTLKYQEDTLMKRKEGLVKWTWFKI